MCKSLFTVCVNSHWKCVWVFDIKTRANTKSLRSSKAAIIEVTLLLHNRPCDLMFSSRSSEGTRKQPWQRQI